MTAAEQDFYGDLRPILDDDLAAFVAETGAGGKHSSMTVVREEGDVDVIAETRRWLDKLRADAGDVDGCKAMQRAVERWGDSSRDSQMRGILAVVRADERGHRGLAAALDQLWQVRGKDRRDFRRLVEWARGRVITSPSRPEDIGCDCDRHPTDLLLDLIAPEGHEDRPASTVEEEPKKVEEEPKKSVATRLVQLADQHYHLGCTPDGEPYAVPRSGPKLVRLLRGGRQSLRAELARAFYVATSTAASQSALADACTVLEGQSQRMDPEELHLRVARLDADALVLDLGDATGRAVVVDATGWRIVDEPPVLFRRTALTGALPAPVPGCKLDDLWRLLNVAPVHRPVLAAALVAELIPDIPHPVLALLGEQGTGKTTAAAMIAAVVDPSTAQVRKAPKDDVAWVTAAAGSWVVALDNLSGIPDWLSDALCRASTGDGDVRRRLYSDGDLHVIAFRRCVILNGIDLGALKDDLADRLVTVALVRIADGDRQRDKHLAASWRDAHPRVLGALLDLTAAVLAALPGVHLDEMPRMADFAHVLAAVDKVLGTDGLRTYLGLRADLAEDALNSDPVLGAIVQHITEEWVGTAATLRDRITPADEKWRTPKGWPATARALTSVLKRRAPSLRRLGWAVDEAGKDDRARAVRWKLTPPPEQRQREDGAREARNARNDDETAGHTPDDLASDSASVAVDLASDTVDDARTSGFHSHDARKINTSVTSTNGTSASVASKTNDESLPPLSGKCSLCKLTGPGPFDHHGPCRHCTTGDQS